MNVKDALNTFSTAFNNKLLPHGLTPKEIKTYNDEWIDAWIENWKFCIETYTKINAIASSPQSQQTLNDFIAASME